MSRLSRTRRVISARPMPASTASRAATMSMAMRLVLGVVIDAQEEFRLRQRDRLARGRRDDGDGHVITCAPPTMGMSERQRATETQAREHTRRP